MSITGQHYHVPLNPIEKATGKSTGSKVSEGVHKRESSETIIGLSLGVH